MKKLIFTFLILLLLMAGAAAYLTLTSSGARLLLRPVLSLFVNFTTVTYGRISGSLLNGLMLEDLELTHIKRLPAQRILRIQTLYVKVNSFRPEGLMIRVDNARLRLQRSDPIVMAGTF